MQKKSNAAIIAKHNSMQNNFDVIVIGAGISGISAGYHLQKHAPNKEFIILEGREAIGGTWDLFRYPGIRSDSDMYTLGFHFEPWTNPKAIADGPSIMDYLHKTAEKYDLKSKMRFGRKVTAIRWSSDKACWSLDVQTMETGKTEIYNCNFLYLCTGYYNYDQGYRPDFKNEQAFGGTIVHPQHWPEDLDYTGKRVVVIGSGATAVTLIPSMADATEKITMLQRTPTYIVGMPAISKTSTILHKFFPDMWAYKLNRMMRVLLTRFMFWYCRKFPERAKKMLRKGVEENLGTDFDIDTHFTPPYNPWEQRLCLAPDSDFFAVLKSGKADVVTDEIAHFTKTGIKLKSGDLLKADIIVTATGLNMQFLGGLDISVDGQMVKSGEIFGYKGMMFEGLPNLAQAFGYTNASWTLKCDLTSIYVTRLLNHMDAQDYDMCIPRIEGHMDEEPLLDFSSGYVQRALADLPKQGTKHPWKMYQNYLTDIWTIGHGRLTDPALKFERSQKHSDIKHAAE